MFELIDHLEMAESAMYDIQNQLSARLVDCNGIEGTLQVSCRKDKCYYYQYKNAAEGKRNYLKKQRDISIIKALAEKEYCQGLDKALEMQLSAIEELKNVYDPHILGNIYEQMHPEKKKLIAPLVLSDQEFVEQWKAFEYNGNPMDFGDTNFYSDRGERMRSKSEMIIANRLISCGIPYRYEAPLILPGGRIVYPDFTLLNQRTRHVFYWEHYGRMDDPDYVNHVLLKKELYSEIGIIPGINLIETYETAKRQLNVVHLRRLIEATLL